MRYLVSKEIKSETKVGKSIYLFDFFFLIVYMAVSFVLVNLVHPSLHIAFYLFSFVMALLLTTKSYTNKKRRNYQSIAIMLRKDQTVYRSVVNVSRRTKLQEEEELKRVEKTKGQEKGKRKKKQEKPKVDKVLQIRGYDKEAQCYLMKNGGFMDLIQINSKDLVNSSADEVEYDCMKFAKSKGYEAVELDLVKHRMAIMDKIRRVLSNITNTYGSLFDGHTSIDNILDEQIVTFDLSTIKEMKPSVFDAQIFNMISLCWDNCVTNGKLMMERLRKAKGEEGALDPEQVTKFLMIIDESHRWINTKKRHALESITIYLREARKFFGGIMLASQSIRDYVPEGSGAEEIDDLKKIFELTQYKFIFHQEADTLPLLDKVFESTLTQSQRNKIPKLEIGENILCIASDRNLEFKVHLTKEEDRIFEGGV